MAVERGEIDRLMILEPPRHGKSEKASVRFPAWFLGRNPFKRIIGCSYNDSLALEFGGRARDVFSSSVHRAVFPDVRLSGHSSAEKKWDVEHRAKSGQWAPAGGYIAAGIGGAITGRGGDVLVIDDPIKNWEEAESLTYRERVWNWYRTTAYTRLEKGGAIIVILTPWHKDDLAGRLLKEQANGGDRWHVVKFPAVATEDEKHRKRGEALWPGKYPLAALERIKQAVGSRAWNALYQMSPIEEDGDIIKRRWWKFFSDQAQHGRQIRIQSWDTAFKERQSAEDKKRKAAFSCCETWDLDGTGFWLEDVWRGQVGFPDLKRQVKIQAMLHQPDMVIIEEKASGISLIQELQLGQQNLPLYGFDPGTTSKTVRLLEATPLIEGGLVHVKAGQPWTDDFINECSDAGPAAEYMDQVDAMTQALKYLKPQFSLWAASVGDFNLGKSQVSGSFDSMMGEELDEFSRMD
jgi:predicted phage terminase large subunit-like protein